MGKLELKRDSSQFSKQQVNPEANKRIPRLELLRSEKKPYSFHPWMSLWFAENTQCLFPHL